MLPLPLLVKNLFRLFNTCTLCISLRSTGAPEWYISSRAFMDEAAFKWPKLDKASYLNLIPLLLETMFDSSATWMDCSLLSLDIDF